MADVRMSLNDLKEKYKELTVKVNTVFFHEVVVDKFYISFIGFFRDK